MGGGGERGGVLHVVWPFIKRALVGIHARKHMLTPATCLIDSGSDKGVKKAAPFEGTFFANYEFSFASLQGEVSFIARF